MPIEVSGPVDPDINGTDRAPEPERRQITVLFADLVGSTDLVDEIGEEDYADVLSSYHALCNEVVRERGGVVAQYLGDGIVCYFGYPYAAEDDAIRAVSTALKFLDRLGSTNMNGAKGRIRSRVGIATGPVVFSGKKSHFGSDAVGACLNKAARLQTLAEPDRVIVCENTHRLIGGRFEFTAMDAQELKGFSAIESIFLVLSEKAGVSYRFDDLRGRATGRLIGRQTELEFLLSRADLARSGDAQQILITAEAGIGKSKLISALRQQGALQNCRTFVLQCSPEHINTPLYPLKSYFQWIAGATETEDEHSIHLKLERLFSQVWRADDTQLQLLLDMLSPYAASRPEDGEASTLLHRRRMFTALSEMIIRAELASEIVVFVVEDVHWIDPSTAEFVETLGRLSRGRRMFLVLSSRPEGRFTASDWPAEQQLELRALDAEQSEALARAASTQTRIPAQTFDLILQKAEGVPLFIEEYVDLAVTAASRGGALELDKIPVTMGNLIQSKLDDLDPTVLHFVQTASALGRVFNIETTQRVADVDEAIVDYALAELARKNLAEKHNPDNAHRMFRFSHALIRDAVYATLSRGLREKLHAAIAVDLVTGEKSSPAADEIVAHHLYRAGQLEDAGERFLNAAKRAISSGYANEALAHLERALSTLVHAPEGEARDRRELSFRVIQAPTLMVAGGPGNPKFGESLEQVRALMERLDSDANIVPVIYNAALHQWALGNLDAAQHGADELSTIAKEAPADDAYLAAHTMQGLVAWHQGRNAFAHSMLTMTVERYDPDHHQTLYGTFLKDFGVFGRFYLSLTESVLGHPEVGMRLAEQCLELAHHVKRPHAIGFAMIANIATAVFRDDIERADEFGIRCLDYATSHGFPEFAAMARFCQGWVSCRRGQLDAGIAAMAEGVHAWDATGFRAWQPLFGAIQAEWMIIRGQTESAAALIDKYEAQIAKTGEAQASSLLRVARAEVASANGDREYAAELIAEAERIAKSQDAHLWLTKIYEVRQRRGIG